MGVRLLQRRALLHPALRSFLMTSRCFSTLEQKFIPSRLDGIEPAEDYQPGGFHPMLIGDVFERGRYKIIHKLGFGGFSTVWMARDQHKIPGELVTLKAMRADASSKPPDELPDLAIPRLLQSMADPSINLHTVDDHFVVYGPNGAHRFLIYPLAGISVLAMADCPGRVSGSRRLRGDLARKVARQTAMTIHAMHGAGLVHGGGSYLTTSNILFRVSEAVRHWSDAEVYAHLSSPQTEDLRLVGGGPFGPHAPAKLVAPVENSHFVDGSLLQESVVVIDFGQSYSLVSPPSDYQAGTVINYQAPETRFEARAGLEADIWALGCAIFEIRAGSPLFESYFGSDDDILRQTVEIFGKLPEPWWSSFDERALWFDENGEPKSAEAQSVAGVLLPASESSIRTRLRAIGTQDDPPPCADEGSMIERSGVTLEEKEVELLGDLLEKMLKYCPEDRITIKEVIDHPWFEL